MLLILEKITLRCTKGLAALLVDVSFYLVTKYGGKDSMRKVTFTFSRYTECVEGYVGAIEIPDDVRDLEKYIEENEDKWTEVDSTGILATHYQSEAENIRIEDVVQ
jgi:hypothetical protein